MHGPNIFPFTIDAVPAVTKQLLDKAGLTIGDIDWVVMHQANKFMLDHLRMKLRVPREKLPLHLDDYGNTVSCTVPIVLKREQEAGHFRHADKLMLIGFGVGYSWGAMILTWNGD